jgi:hypothetical protein
MASCEFEQAELAAIDHWPLNQRQDAYHGTCHPSSIVALGLKAAVAPGIQINHGTSHVTDRGARARLERARRAVRCPLKSRLVVVSHLVIDPERLFYWRSLRESRHICSEKAEDHAAPDKGQAGGNQCNAQNDHFSQPKNRILGDLPKRALRDSGPFGIALVALLLPGQTVTKFANGQVAIDLVMAT